MERPSLEQAASNRVESEEYHPHNARDHQPQPNYHGFHPSPTESLLQGLWPNLNRKGGAIFGLTNPSTTEHITPGKADFPQSITSGPCPGTSKISPLHNQFIFRTQSNDFPSDGQHYQRPFAGLVDNHETPTIFTDSYDVTVLLSSNNHTLLEHDTLESWELSGNAGMDLVYPRAEQDYLEEDVTMTWSELEVNQADPLWTSWVDNYLGDTVPGSPSQQFTLSSALARGEKPSAALYSGSKPSVQLKGVSSNAVKPKKSKSQRKTPGLSRIPVESRRILEDHFQKNPYPPKNEIAELAQLAALKPNTVKNWFNNTRARSCFPGASMNLVFIIISI